jgi:hypothetical protein
LARLPGWQLAMVRVDPMHTINMGVARWSVASALVELMDRSQFDDRRSSRERHLQWAYRDFLMFCLRTGWRANVDVFTPARIGIKKAKEFPEASYKAYNTRVLVSWLAHVANTAADAEASDHHRALALHLWALDELFKSMEDCAERYFTAAEAERFIHAGNRLRLNHCSCRHGMECLFGNFCAQCRQLMHGVKATPC